MPEQNELTILSNLFKEHSIVSAIFIAILWSILTKFIPKLFDSMNEDKKLEQDRKKEEFERVKKNDEFILHLSVDRLEELGAGVKYLNDGQREMIVKLEKISEDLSFVRKELL